MADPVAMPESVPVIDARGNLVEIDSAHLGDALKFQGFSPPSAAQYQVWEKAQQYKGVIPGAVAFAEGAGEGLLGPVIPGIETALGRDPAEMRALAEARPALHTAGEVTGFALPLIATAGASTPVQGAGVAAKGASLAAKAAEYTIPSLMTGAGEAVAKGVAKIAGEGAVGRIATTGARLATEGGILGASSVATKLVTEDPNLTAEKAASEIGLSALTGGLLGVGGRTLAEAVPTGITEKLTGWLGEVAGNRGVKAAGAIQGDINKSLKRMSREDLNAVGQRAVENGWVSPLSTPADTFAATRAAMDEAGGKMGELLKTASATEGAPTFNWDDIRKTVNEGVLAPMSEKASTLPAVKQAEGVLENFSKVYGERDLSLVDLHGMRRDLDAIIYQHGRALDPFAKAVAEPLKGVRDVISDAIDKGVEATQVGRSAEWRALNGAFRDAKVINGFAERGMLRAEGNNAISLTETMGGLTGVATHGLSGGVLGTVGSVALRRHSAGTIAWAATAAQQALARMAEGGESRLAAGLGRIFGASGAKAGAEASSAVLNPGNYRKIADATRGHANDLERMASASSAQTGELRQHAPDHAAALDSLAARGVAHLASKLPQEGPRAAFDAPYQPSTAELAPFNRAAEIAQNPAAILHHIADGTVHPDHVQALGAIYPALQKEMQAQAIERLSKALASGERMPFRTRMGLGMFLGSDLDSLMSPRSMQANQLATAMAPKDQQGLQPGPRALENLGVAGRMSTPQQAAAARGTA